MAVLCTVQIANAQKVFSLHAMKIEGNLEAFEKVETELHSKVAQDAVNKGDVLYWGLFKVTQFNAGEVPGDYNYVFVQWANNIDDLLSTKSGWWNNVDKVLSSSEQEQRKTLIASYKAVKDARNVFVVEDEAYDQGNATYFQKRTETGGMNRRS